ncbi:hypothetical protein ACQKP0_02290 [Heyndrickxia sp. NPDC080065]|uniref:hypothetical protein n=1 Tax=Heyndrickxia sp. NPDC080065 TaxID=3390568 RepID=UPI003D079027
MELFAFMPLLIFLISIGIFICVIWIVFQFMNLNKERNALLKEIARNMDKRNNDSNN